jgi:UDP-N-acetylglucosamine diphosphorylase/glucosamine-1-phosphate N-acetyltransferase
MRERWEKVLKTTTSTLTETYLQSVFPANASTDNLYLNGAVFGTDGMGHEVMALKTGQKLVSNNTLVAFRSEPVTFEDIYPASNGMELINSELDCSSISYPWDIFSQNDKAIKADYTLLTSGRKSRELPKHITVIGENIFLEEGAAIAAGCIINSNSGPVYIGRDAEIMEGAIIRGPFAAGEHAVLKMGAKVYGATTLGPGCKVGGEISNVVFFANSNKAHDGFLGNAVIGEWCNLGADTNCSNLKNNYDEVKTWNEHLNKSVKTGLTFCGLMMGDHSKAGINTMFNTGTIVGVSCNIYGGGFPPTFIPSFCWGGGEGLTTYRLDRAMDTANRMMGRRDKELSESDKKMLQTIFDKTAAQRNVFAQTATDKQ